jgi:hypothetical protein
VLRRLAQDEIEQRAQARGIETRRHLGIGRQALEPLPRSASARSRPARPAIGSSTG